MVIWITGLSGAGKTTVSNALWRSFEHTVPELVRLDGDVMRAAFEHDLGYEIEARVAQIKRMQRLAKVLVDQGKVVLVAALYANEELLAWNRLNFPSYLEVYMDTPMHVLRARDTNGLYSKAARGEMPNVVGLDIPWTPPSEPDLVLDSSGSETPEDLARVVARQVPRFAQQLELSGSEDSR